LSPNLGRTASPIWPDLIYDRHNRSAIVEHPFGTLKCRAGYRHFLLRGFDKVRGEWSLMALCYNFTRVLNILGFERFIAAVAKASTSRLYALAHALERLLIAPETFRTRFAQQIVVPRRQPVFLS
jgi:Transposase DDE domain